MRNRSQYVKTTFLFYLLTNGIHILCTYLKMLTRYKRKSPRPPPPIFGFTPEGGKTPKIP